MTSKKTVRVPVAADGVPLAVASHDLDKTRELPACAAPENDVAEPDGRPGQAAPREILDDEITVPVQSSIESTLTFELLRRQSTQVDGDESDGENSDGKSARRS